MTKNKRFATLLTAENKTVFYVSLILPFLMNSHRLTNFLFDKSIIVGIPWQFNAAELAYQTFFQFVFCYVFGYIALNVLPVLKGDGIPTKTRKYLFLFLVFVVFLTAVGISQRLIFDNVLQVETYRTTYILRYSLSAVSMVILVRFFMLTREKRAKELENEMLKSAYYNAQLKNLKAQVNPHFLFNSFSSLSSIIAEDVPLAQKYVANLAKVFRYSLTENASQLVDLNKEIELLEANIELLKIRYESALQISINKANIEKYQIPSMSLQPLLENVTKHNHISNKWPMTLTVYVEDDEIHLINSLTTPKYDSPSNGIGLFNLNERYKLLLNKEITIQKTKDQFQVRLPLVIKNSTP
ncbi:MAG: histidine kinase [Bacteroidota bacterium]